MAAHDSSDRQWYLGRIRDNRCKIVQFDANGLFEYPKPFNHDCFTILELITAIFTLLAREFKKLYDENSLLYSNHLGYPPSLACHKLNLLEV